MDDDEFEQQDRRSERRRAHTISPLDERSIRLIVEQLREDQPQLFASIAQQHSRWDMSITLGNILTILVIVAGLWSTTVQVSNRLTVIETKLEPLWQQYAQEHGMNPSEPIPSTRRGAQ